MPKFIDHVDISPSTTGSWVDVDVSDQLGSDAGSVAGVLLEIVNPSATEYTWGVRKNGSSDTITGVIEDNGHTWAAVGVDGNDIFEANIQNTAVNIHILGYVMDAEGAFFDSAIDKTPATSEGFNTVDISGDTGTDTAVCAFFLVDKPGSGGTDANDTAAFRINGYADARTDSVYFPGDLRGAVMGVDANEILEIHVDTKDTPTIWLVGYLTANFTAFGTTNDYQTNTTGSYVDTDVSADVPADAVGLLLEVGRDSGNEISYKHRKNGSTFDPAGNGDVSTRDYCFVELDANAIFEQYVSSSTNNLCQGWGYFTAPSSAQTISATMAGTSTDTVGEVVLNIVQSSTLAGTSADSAAPQTTDVLTASLGGVSTDSAAPTLTDALTATLAGTSTDTADPLATAALVATLDGLSTDSATPTVSDAIAATLAGTSADSGAITAGGVELLAATLAGTSLDSGAITKAVSLSSTLAGTSTDTGDILATAALVATLDGLSSDSAAPTLADALTATLAGTSLDSGIVSIGGVELLVATLAGTSLDSASVSKAVDLSSTLAGTSTDTASIAKLVALLASMDGVSVDSGAIQTTDALDATLAGTSLDSASPTLTDLLDATLVGTSLDSAAVTLGDLTLITATLDGTSVDSAAPSLTDALVAELAGTSSDTASVSRTLGIVSTLAGVSSDSGIITLSEIGSALDSDTTALVLKHADSTTLVLMDSDSTLLERLDEGESEWPT